MRLNRSLNKARTIVRGREQVRVDPEGEGRVGVAEVFG